MPQPLLPFFDFYNMRFLGVQFSLPPSPRANRTGPNAGQNASQKLCLFVSHRNLNRSAEGSPEAPVVLVMLAVVRVVVVRWVVAVVAGMLLLNAVIGEQLEW